MVWIQVGIGDAHGRIGRRLPALRPRGFQVPSRLGTRFLLLTFIQGLVERKARSSDAQAL